MAAMLRGFPRLDLMAYDTEVPGSWEELVQERVNGISDAFADSVQIDFWDGMSSVRGYRAIRWIDAIFYKTPHLSEANWDAALQYNTNAVYSLLSRRFSNWKYASSRLHLSPFSWISSGAGSDFERARDPQYVAKQLAAFRKWGTGREFANYAYNGLRRSTTCPTRRRCGVRAPRARSMRFRPGSPSPAGQSTQRETG
jgi:hypothetical protein